MRDRVACLFRAVLNLEWLPPARRVQPEARLARPVARGVSNREVGSGATSAVTTGYGIWINDSDDPAPILVKENGAAIKISGFNEYSRILWTNCNAYSPSSAVLELHATTAVQTASGVPFNVGGIGGNANCNAGSYSAGEFPD